MNEERDKVDLDLFDLTKPIKLIRAYVSPSRNKYNPGVYRPNELPQGAYKTLYCEPNRSKEVKESVTESSVKREKTGVTRDKNGNIRIKPHEDGYDTRIISPQSSEIPVASKLNVNQASAAELEALNGIGPSIASKVLEYREQSAFIDFADLNARISLPFGGKWENYELSFE